jgi:polyisoprenoid-binding protein YceI
MENAVRNRIKDPEGGDGFDVLKPGVPVVSWKELGFPLPQPLEKKERAVPVDMKIPTTWRVSETGPDDPPLIQFRFPAPLDNYTGEVTKVRGEINLSKNASLNGATGIIEADPLSVTMGEAQLDNTIQGSLFLYTKKYPTAKFVVNLVSTDGQPLSYGRLSFAEVSGTFTLKGTSYPLASKVEIEPVLGEKANPLLLVRGFFQIDLRKFDIEGADGPEPGKYTLKFDVNLKMTPKSVF